MKIFAFLATFGVVFVMAGCSGASDRSSVDPGAAGPQASSVTPEMKSALARAKQQFKKKDAE